MITQDKFMQIILERFPGFYIERWLAYLGYWAGEKRGPCLDMSEFSDYALDLILSEKLELLPEIFDLIERFLVEGDQMVQDVAATCFLENLLNRTTETIDPKTFIPLLGPKSRAYCKAWDEFTEVYTEGLWDQQDAFGGREMLQPNNLFTLAEYKQFVRLYEAICKEDQMLSYQNPEHIERKNYLVEQRFGVMLSEYRSRLPVYLLARCPICGGRVWEAIDTYSLNGLGWIDSKTGYGWHGTVTTETDKTERPPYIAECKHIRMMTVGVNLQCKRPDDVFQSVDNISERPFIMTRLMALEQACAVIHTLPIGRFDDVQLKPHYTAHFITYFSIDQGEFDRLMQPAYEEMSLIVYNWADYELHKWVEKGKLYWLDRSSSALQLRNQPLGDFPYDSLRGYEGHCVIFDGRLKYLGRRSGKYPCPERDQEGGLFSKIRRLFLKNNPKKLMWL